MVIDPKKFEDIVRQALDDLPERFQPFLENVAVLVEEEPHPDDLEHVGLDPDEELFGLYHGVPLTDREVGYTGLPDRVIIYRGPILRSCVTSREVQRQIRETVIHEIGHHLGLGDDDMVF
ncbi:MAG: metallopeptidase family protein [Gemmatimonadetes bacterium]|nr:metallopeptidase family protein [Gemmatimonadota bacterium]